MKTYLELLILLVIAGSAFGQKDNKQVIRLADKYYERCLETFPESAYFLDITLTRNDKYHQII